MLRLRPTVTALLLVLLLACAWPAQAKRKAGSDPTVPTWLVLGPTLHPLPAFHDAAQGGVEPGALLDGPALPAGATDPRPGGEVEAPDGTSTTWVQASADDDGVVVLERPKDADPGRPAVAWLVAHLRVERFTELSVEVLGSRPRAVWIDGERKASGGEGDDETVEAKLSLEPGRHTVALRTVHDGEGRGAWTVGLAFASGKDGPDVAWSTAPARELTIEDVVDGFRVSAATLSPDGKLAAISTTGREPGAADDVSWVEVRRTSDGALVRAWKGTGAPSRAAWAPTGRRLSYVGDGPGEKRSTLWVVDLDSGEETAIVSGVERLGAYAWSPTGTAVVYSTSAEPETNDTGIKRLRNLLDRQAGWRTKSALHVVTVPGGARRALTAGPETASFQAFSPDGARVLFTRNLEDLSRRPYTTTELWETVLATGETRRLLDSPWLRGASYAPDGDRLLLVGGPSMFDRAGATTPADVVPNDFDGQAYVWTPGATGVDPITRDLDPSVDEATWNAADGKIYLRVGDRDRGRVVRFDPGTRAFEDVDTGGLDVVRGMDVALRTPTVLLHGDGVWRASRVVVVDQAGRSRTVADPAAERMADVRTGEVRPFSFQSPKGRTIDGRFYLPPGFDASRRYPVIVYYYGGTSPVTRDFGGRYPKEWWTSHGYVVYVPQPSGATGYGQAFSALHVNTWAEDVVGEIVEGTKQFLAAHPFADPDRVGCIGASYGGFTTMKVLTESDLFEAAVAHAGISALSSYWGEGYWGYLYSAVATADSFPWNREDLYVERSPLFEADKIETPLLLTHGAGDTNVPPGESDQLFVALRLLGAPVEYLSIEGQNHWIVERDKRILWSKSIVAWFDRWLKDDASWWNHLYPPVGDATP